MSGIGPECLQHILCGFGSSKAGAAVQLPDGVGRMIMSWVMVLRMTHPKRQKRCPRSARRCCWSAVDQHELRLIERIAKPFCHFSASPPPARRGPPPDFELIFNRTLSALAASIQPDPFAFPDKIYDAALFGAASDSVIRSTGAPSAWLGFAVAGASRGADKENLQVLEFAVPSRRMPAASLTFLLCSCRENGTEKIISD